MIFKKSQVKSQVFSEKPIFLFPENPNFERFEKSY